MRLFTALDLPADVVGRLEAFIAKLKPTANIAWSKPSNLHVTTRFIGEWPEARLSELQTELGALPPRGSISVHLNRVGFFPNPHQPRNFWCGVEAPGIEALAADTDGALNRLGLEPEKRAFSPHLTLARIKDRIALQPLREAIAAETEATGLDFGRFEAGSFFLYRSELRPSGSVYTKLSEFPFHSP